MENITKISGCRNITPNQLKSILTDKESPFAISPTKRSRLSVSLVRVMNHSMEDIISDLSLLVDYRAYVSKGSLVCITYKETSQEHPGESIWGFLYGKDAEKITLIFNQRDYAVYMSDFGSMGKVIGCFRFPNIKK